MAAIQFVTPEELAAVKQELAEVKALLQSHVIENDEWLPKEMAMLKAGLKTRDSLEKYARASRPEAQEAGRITYRKQGVKCLYLRSSCLDYAQRKLGQPAFRA